MSNQNSDHLQFQYEQSINLWNAQHQAIWAMFSNIMLANSIFIAAIILLFAQNQFMLGSILGAILSLFGIGINILWSFINNRGFRYQELRIKQALHYEHLMNRDLSPNRNLNDNIYDLVSDGELFAKYCPQKPGCKALDAKLKTNFANDNYHNIPTRKTTKYIMWSFMALYSVFLLLFILPLFNLSIKCFIHLILRIFQLILNL